MIWQEGEATAEGIIGSEWLHHDDDRPSGETERRLLASILQSTWAKIGVHATSSSHPVDHVVRQLLCEQVRIRLFPPEEGFDVYYNPDGLRLYFANKEPGWGPPASAKFVTKLEEAPLRPAQAQQQTAVLGTQYKGCWQEALFLPIANLVSLNLVS